MSDTTTCQLLTYILSIAVGINHKGRSRLRERTVQIVGKLHTIAHLLSIILAAKNLQFVAHKHVVATLAGIRQKRTIYTKHFSGISIEYVEQIARRTMVYRQMMQLACRLRLNG